VQYVETNEPGTQMYLAWQEKSDPTCFLHLFIFADEAARTRHGKSEAVRRFESMYSPELVGGEVVFTDYELISGPRRNSGRNCRSFSNPQLQSVRDETKSVSLPEWMLSQRRG